MRNGPVQYAGEKRVGIISLVNVNEIHGVKNSCLRHPWLGNIAIKFIIEILLYGFMLSFKIIKYCVSFILSISEKKDLL